MLEQYASESLWIIIIGFVIAFILAFGIGANDVANSFGTSVGSGVLTIRSACFLATFCEISGAILIGYKVSDTMRKGILDVNLYIGSEQELMLGFVSALASSAVWLLVATFLRLPISGTHSIVGSTLGFSLIARGTKGVQWFTLGKIVGSWFISPVLSGLMSSLLFCCIRLFILKAKKPMNAALLSLPLIYGLTTFINVISIVLDGPKLLFMDNIVTWVAILISVIFSVIIAILVQVFVVPWQHRKVTQKCAVKFSINDSTETTPYDSPNHKRRPASTISTQENPLPDITEQTELASFNNLSELNPCFFTNGKIQADNSEARKSYEFDSEIIEKCDQLLNKNRSLDNMDLTVTSLNFIDDQQQLNGNARLRTKHEPLQTFFDPNKQERSQLKSTATDVVIAMPDANGSTSASADQSIAPINNNSKGAKNAHDATDSGHGLPSNSSKVPLIASRQEVSNKVDEPEEVSQLFSFLQILTATFGSFAHGGNDVCNAIGPLIALWMIYKEGTVLQQSETPITLLLYGGVGISLGLWVWGRRVIETIGNDLTKITPSTGFTIEIGSALTVLIASKIGLPISTTHCKVGSVIFVGFANSFAARNESQKPSTVDWGLFRNIVYAWIVTVPIAAILSATFMFGLTKLML